MFPGFSLLSFLKMMLFPFFQSLGTSPDSHGFLNMMESNLKTTLTNSFNILGCLVSVPIDLNVCSFMWSQSCSSLRRSRRGFPPSTTSWRFRDMRYLFSRQLDSYNFFICVAFLNFLISSPLPNILVTWRRR